MDILPQKLDLATHHRIMKNNCLFKKIHVFKTEIHWYIIEMFWKHKLWKDSNIFQRQHITNQHPCILESIHLTYKSKERMQILTYFVSICGIILWHLVCQKYDFLHLKCFLYIISWIHNVLYIFYEWYYKSLLLKSCPMPFHSWLIFLIKESWHIINICIGPLILMVNVAWQQVRMEPHMYYFLKLLVL